MKKTVTLFVTLVMAFAFTIPASASGMAAKPTLMANTTAIQSLTVEERAGLLFMYEEEKLARDVYNALYNLWEQPTFQTIAASEQIHMNTIGSLMVHYDVPVPENPPGIFDDLELQALFDNLMIVGNLSLADALKVGATMEEIEIVDLQSLLEQTNKNNIERVYANLIKASYNHLRSFVKVLYRLTGEIYEPQYLDPELYESIIGDINGRGKKASGALLAGTAASAGNGDGDCNCTCACDNTCNCDCDKTCNCSCGDNCNGNGGSDENGSSSGNENSNGNDSSDRMGKRAGKP